MNIGVLREAEEGEARVAIVPESVKRLKSKGHRVVVEASSGARAHFPDQAYRDAGAEIEPSRPGVCQAAELLVQIRPPTPEATAMLRESSALVSYLYPLANRELVGALGARKATAFAVEMIPRTTLAQSMDVLSSQATVAGYHAVLLAAAALPKFFPMMMTAAGTIAPAKVLVIGAGVAGLTAIATARRLGAVVEAFDVRAAVKEQVLSLGAKFVEVVGVADAQTQGGYAREVTAEERELQTAALARHLARSDACITTALVPGKKAPILVTADMVRAMRPGSVLIDLAAEQGGNCELTVPGKTVVESGVSIVGAVSVPSKVAFDASQMYSRNMEKFILHVASEGGLKLDMNDEITVGCLILRGGEVVHPTVREALQGGGR